jgi:hypothetical protein
MLKTIVTENEFDSLADATQMHYLFCPKCELFYLVECKDHSCATTKCMLTPLEYSCRIPEIKALYWQCKHCGMYVRSSWSNKCLCEEG